MLQSQKDVLLVGFGAVGVLYAWVLQKGGTARVTVIARSNYHIVNEHGVNLKSLRYGESLFWRPYRVLPSVELAADRQYSHVIVTTKVINELQRTSDLLHPLLSFPYTGQYVQPTYVLMQNGINIEVDLYNALKTLHLDPRIIGSSLFTGCTLTDGNVVEHSYFDQVHIGVYRAEPNITINAPAETALLVEFGDMLSAGGTDVIVVPEIHRVKFRKNAANCWMNPVTALSRISYQGIFRKPANTVVVPTNPREDIRTPSQLATAAIPSSFPSISDYTIPLIYDILEEVTAVGRVLYPPSGFPEQPEIDISLPLDTLGRLSLIGAKPTSNERPSMLVDVEAGRPTELEALVGELVRAGRKTGVQMPHLETIYALMLIVQANLLHEHRLRSASAAN